MERIMLIRTSPYGKHCVQYYKGIFTNPHYIHLTLDEFVKEVLRKRPKEAGTISIYTKKRNGDTARFLTFEYKSGTYLTKWFDYSSEIKNSEVESFDAHGRSPNIDYRVMVSSFGDPKKYLGKHEPKSQSEQSI